MDLQAPDTNLSIDSKPPDPLFHIQFDTPWDGLDTDFVLNKHFAQESPKPRLKLNGVLSLYLSILPIGSSGHLSYWRDQWDSCQDASSYRRRLQSILHYEDAAGQKVSETVTSSAADRSKQHTVNGLGNYITMTIQPRKRARESDGDQKTGGSPAKRLRLSDISPPTSPRTRNPANRESAPSPEPSTIAFDYATSNADATLQISLTHNQILVNLNHLLTLVAQAEDIEAQLRTHYVEEPITAWDFRSSAIFDNLAGQHARLQERARKLCPTLDKLALELKGWTAIGNAYDHNRAGTNQAMSEAELERHHLTLEKGPLLYWLERGQQSFQIWIGEP